MIGDGIRIGCFYSEESLDAILRKTIRDYVDIFVNFIESRRPIKIMTLEYPENIGYVLDDNGKENTNLIHVVLLKDKTNATKYGFIINSFIPTDSKNLIAKVTTSGKAGGLIKP